METKFFVFRAYRYRQSGSWEYQLIKMCDTLTEAKQVYHANMGAIIKESNDFAMCVIFDSFANKVAGDFSDTHTEPEPESNEE
jgi:hypothetical protein